MSYETLIAVRNIAYKQVEELNKLINELCKPIKISSKNGVNTINTIYHACYPVEFEINDDYCYSALSTILTDAETYYRPILADPKNVGSSSSNLALLRHARALYKVTTSDDEKKRLAGIIDTIVAKIPGLIKAYNNGTDYTDDEIAGLYTIFNKMYNEELADKIVKQVTVLEFAGQRGMDCRTIEQELHKLIVEWIAKDDYKILLGGYE